jgi:hypothetical protein
MWTNQLFKVAVVTLSCGVGAFRAPNGAGRAFQIPPCGGSPWIKQTVVLQDLRGRLPRDLTGHLYLDIYPAKKTADPAKQDFELVMYVRDDNNREIGVNAVHNKTVFRAEAANYFNYLLRHRVRPADIPQSYLLELDWNVIDSRYPLIITLPPLPGPICIPMVSFRKPDNIRRDSAPVICKCPPGPCTGCPRSLNPPPGSHEHFPSPPPSQSDIYYSQFATYAEKYKALKN